MPTLRMARLWQSLGTRGDAYLGDDGPCVLEFCPLRLREEAKALGEKPEEAEQSVADVLADGY